MIYKCWKCGKKGDKESFIEENVIPVNRKLFAIESRLRCPKCKSIVTAEKKQL